MSELGETIGILSAQSIGEPGTQLTMRTFHTGGIFSGQTLKNLTSPVKGNIIYDTNVGGKKIKTKYNEKVFYTTKEKILNIKEIKGRKYSFKAPKNCLIFVKPNQKVEYKQVIAQVIKKEKKIKKTKEIKEIKTTISGLTFIKNNQLWVLNKNIIIYQQFYINILNKKQKKYKIIIKNSFIQLKLKLNTRNLKKIKQKNKYFRKKNKYIIEQNIKITKKLLTNKQKADQNIKIKTLLKRNTIKTLIDEKTCINKKYRNLYSTQIIEKRKKHIALRKNIKYNITKPTKPMVPTRTIIEKNSTLFEIIYKKQKTEDIVQGLPKIEQLLEIKQISGSKFIRNNPNHKLKTIFSKLKHKYSETVAVRKSLEKLQQVLVNKIQAVYISQGVEIADKHIEVVIKQMTSKVIIMDNNDTSFIAGEIIELNRIEKINSVLKNKARYEPVVLGISKIAQLNSSFISQSSFQETIRTLSSSALKGKTDWLQGLKENLILGNLIPAGTNETESNLFLN